MTTLEWGLHFTSMRPKFYRRWTWKPRIAKLWRVPLDCIGSWFQVPPSWKTFPGTTLSSISLQADEYWTKIGGSSVRGQCQEFRQFGFRWVLADGGRILEWLTRERHLSNTNRKTEFSHTLFVVSIRSGYPNSGLCKSHVCVLVFWNLAPIDNNYWP